MFEALDVSFAVIPLTPVYHVHNFFFLFFFFQKSLLLIPNFSEFGIYMSTSALWSCGIFPILLHMASGFQIFCSFLYFLLDFLESMSFFFPTGSLGQFSQKLNVMKNNLISFVTLLGLVYNRKTLSVWAREAEFELWFCLSHISSVALVRSRNVSEPPFFIRLLWKLDTSPSWNAE